MLVGCCDCLFDLGGYFVVFFWFLDLDVVGDVGVEGVVCCYFVVFVGDDEKW